LLLAIVRADLTTPSTSTTICSPCAGAMTLSAWRSILRLKLAGTVVLRGKQAYVTVLQVCRAAEVGGGCGLVDVCVVQVFAVLGPIARSQRF
jgi:hypothetical protein